MGLLAAFPPWALAAPPVLLVLGDSLSAAYGIGQDRGWVALMQQRLAERGHPHRVVNASVSGETSAGGLARLPQLLGQHRPAVVVIELGANDGLRAIPAKVLGENLRAMIDLAQAGGARVLLLGIRLPPNYGAVFNTRFEKVYAEVAAEKGVALEPFFLRGVAEQRALMQPDGLHPGAEAQPVLLDNVWPALVPLLEPGAAALSGSAPTSG